MSAAFQKLRSKLSELFQLDAAAELDFGIYRILNARRVEISEFLDSLEGQVDRILADAMDSGAGEAKAELAKAEADLRAMGLDETALAAVPKIRELREKLAAAGSDPTALSHEIFSHLATFFSRYYKDGDFISLRRYKKDTYAITYEGEEVKLHWANADQYYIKSSETLRDYSFRLGPAPKGYKPDTRPNVSFKLVEADIEKDNTKAVAGQERRFVFQGVVESDYKDHLILGFAYLPLGKAEKQTALNEAAAKAILAEHAKGVFTDLAANDATYTVKSKTRSILAKHLTEYTGRNTFDYFVHKDLGGFLRRELDFYVKNEVLHLDDLDEAPESNWNETRAKLKALRSIAAKVIRFLAQLEDFQKKLWLKKKFVTGCDYVVTLDRIPEGLYPEIASCDAQRVEWVNLFAIDEIKGDLGRTGYSVPLKMDFLKENQNLVLDSRWFNKTFQLRVAEKMNSSNIDGIVGHGENFQFSRLITRNHNRRVQFSYIDPPYNTGKDEFSYKDSYQRSSWLCMLQDRLNIFRELLVDSGCLLISIGEHEIGHLTTLCDSIFGRENRAITFIWNTDGNIDNQKKIKQNHEFVLCYCRDINLLKNPAVIDPNVNKDSKLFNELIVNTIVKNGPGNPPSDLLLPAGFPADFEEGEITPGNANWPRFSESVKVENSRIISPLLIRSGWSSKELIEEFIANDMQSIKDSKGAVTTFVVKNTGAPYVIKNRMEGHGHVLSILRNMGSTQSMAGALRQMGIQFGYPKPIELIQYLCSAFSDKKSLVADFFGGSGPLGHATIELNRADGGTRKYVLAEMGEHFDTVLVPRLKKVIYSKDWKEGKPQSRNTGISHCFKILRLESYEDTLNNLRLHRSRTQELALEAMSPEAREQYQLGYMLDLETSGSQSLLNVSAFTDPWNYTLEIASGTACETKTTKVDLVETFNWLLGLTVLAQGHGGGVQWVEGTNPEGDKVLVLWRNTTEVDADALNDWCKKQKVSVLDGEFGLIYINGDHHLENLRREDQTWKVRLTDEEFPKLMWEGC
jgi:adenine-specific DNA-methyltransferase